MDFELTEEQKMFKDTLREFLDKRYASIADKRDREGPFTKEETIRIYKEFREIGIGFDPETAKTFFGDPVIFGIFSEEVSRVWASLFPVLGLSFPVTYVSVASDETRERWLSKLEESEIIGCYAVTEPEAGCDTRNLRTTAVLESDHYILNGRKTWISNAPIADIVLVAATDKRTGIQDLFLVDKEASPFETNELHKIGWNAAPTGEIFFDDCHIPKEHSLTEIIANAATKGMGLRDLLPFPEGIMNLFSRMAPLNAIFCMLRAGMALMATGISQAALDASLKYARERVQFNKPIGKTQLVQEMLYEMVSTTESSRLLSYRALDLVTNGNPEARKISSLAKCYACEGCVKTTYLAMQIHGAMGLSNELPLERYFRDARMMTIPDGTTEMQKLIVGYEMLGKGMSAYV